METKSLVELVFVDCAIAAITPSMVSVLTCTAVGECRDPVLISLWYTTIWRKQERLREEYQHARFVGIATNSGNAGKAFMYALLTPTRSSPLPEWRVSRYG